MQKYREVLPLFQGSHAGIVARIRASRVCTSHDLCAERSQCSECAELDIREMAPAARGSRRWGRDGFDMETQRRPSPHRKCSVPGGPVEQAESPTGNSTRCRVKIPIFRNSFSPPPGEVKFQSKIQEFYLGLGRIPRFLWI